MLVSQKRIAERAEDFYGDSPEPPGRLDVFRNSSMIRVKP